MEEPDLEALINPKKRAKEDAAKACDAAQHNAWQKCDSRSCTSHTPCARAQEAKAKAKAEELASQPNLQPELCAAFEELAGTQHTRTHTRLTRMQRMHARTHAHPRASRRSLLLILFFYMI